MFLEPRKQNYYMADILDFKKKEDPETLRLVAFGNEVDELASRYIATGSDLTEITIITGHRVAEMLNCLGEDKYAVWQTLRELIDERITNPQG